jgi:hypothetical protein
MLPSLAGEQPKSLQRRGRSGTHGVGDQPPPPMKVVLIKLTSTFSHQVSTLECTCVAFFEALVSLGSQLFATFCNLTFAPTSRTRQNQGCQMVYFLTKNPNLGILECLWLENVGIFYWHLDYIKAIWYILWSFSNLVVIWHIFYTFWYIVLRKIWQPWPKLKATFQGNLFLVVAASLSLYFWGRCYYFRKYFCKKLPILS